MCSPRVVREHRDRRREQKRRRRRWRPARSRNGKPSASGAQREQELERLERDRRLESERRTATQAADQRCWQSCVSWRSSWRWWRGISGNRRQTRGGAMARSREADVQRLDADSQLMWPG